MAGPGVTAKEISEGVGLPQATTYRIRNLLVAEEYPVRLPDLSGFALGRRASRLALPVPATPSTAARAVVAHMRTQTTAAASPSRSGPWTTAAWSPGSPSPARPPGWPNRTRN